jgi:hypothetical protein
VHLLPLGQQGEAGQGVGVLPADKHAQPAEFGGHHPHRRAVTPGPGQLFRPRRDELPVQGDQPAAAVEEEVRVPHGPHAHGSLLRHPDGEEDPVAPGDLAQLGGPGAGHLHGVVEQAPEEAVLVQGGVEHGPEREAGHERLPEGHQVGPLGRRLGHQAVHPLDGGIPVQEHRRRLDRRRPENGIRVCRHAAAPRPRPRRHPPRGPHLAFPFRSGAAPGPPPDPSEAPSPPPPASASTPPGRFLRTRVRPPRATATRPLGACRGRRGRHTRGRTCRRGPAAAGQGAGEFPWSAGVQGCAEPRGRGPPPPGGGRRERTAGPVACAASATSAAGSRTTWTCS